MTNSVIVMFLLYPVLAFVLMWATFLIIGAGVTAIKEIRREYF